MEVRIYDSQSPLLDSFQLVNEEARRAGSPDNRRVFYDRANQGAIDGDKVRRRDPSALQDPKNVQSLGRFGDGVVGIIVPLQSVTQGQTENFVR